MATVLLQARTGSTRLPGKALMTIMAHPMLYYTVESLKKSSVVTRIVLAIPDLKKDNPLVEQAARMGIDCFRGSEANVLERFYRAAVQYKDDYYFRATGDNPIMDYENPRRLLEHLVNNNYEYTAERYMPLGSVVEAFTFDALERCFNEAESVADKEHVTLFIKKSKRFNTGYIEASPAYHYPKLRLTVDYPDDFKRAELIIENLYRKNGVDSVDGVYIPHFKEIIDYCNKQGWLKNKHL